MCNTIIFTALTQFSDYKWYMNGTRVEVIYQNYLLECLSTNPGGNESCLNYQVFQYNFVKSEGEVYTSTNTQFNYY